MSRYGCGIVIKGNIECEILVYEIIANEALAVLFGSFYVYVVAYCRVGNYFNFGNFNYVAVSKLFNTVVLGKRSYAVFCKRAVEYHKLVERRIKLILVSAVKLLTYNELRRLSYAFRSKVGYITASDKIEIVVEISGICALINNDSQVHPALSEVARSVNAYISALFCCSVTEVRVKLR